MNYAVRDVVVRRKVAVLTFSALTLLQAGAHPDAPVGGAVILSIGAGLVAATITAMYQAYMNHLAEELAERRNQKLAALAIDD